MDEKGATLICHSVSSTDSFDASASASARPMYLIVVSGGIPGAMTRLAGGTNRIGRSQENSVKLQDESVSRRHAMLVSDPSGEVWLTDLGSTNGTFLNGAFLAPNAPQRIQDGDRIQFGAALVLKFVRLDPCDEHFQRVLFERTVRDTLTELFNRAYFLDQIGPLSDLGASKGLGLAVLMVDVDHFKRVNDTFGHDTGDVVLREVATVLRESTRSEDLVARYGGEEFIAALPVASPDQATARAERIRVNLANRRIPLPPGVGPSNARLKVTASLGLAYSSPGHPRTVAPLITAADQCLYHAKNSGRNRVVFRVDPPGSREFQAEAATPGSAGR